MFSPIYAFTNSTIDPNHTNTSSEGNLTGALLVLIVLLIVLSGITICVCLTALLRLSLSKAIQRLSNIDATEVETQIQHNSFQQLNQSIPCTNEIVVSLPDSSELFDIESLTSTNANQNSMEIEITATYMTVQGLKAENLSIRERLFGLNKDNIIPSSTETMRGLPVADVLDVESIDSTSNNISSLIRTIVPNRFPNIPVHQAPLPYALSTLNRIPY